MIYLLQLLMIFISFLLSYRINKSLKNYDRPGKNKIQKQKVLTSGGIVPFILLSIIIVYLIYFDTLDYSNYYISIPKIWIAPLSILIFTLISFYDDLNFIAFQIRLFVQLSIVYLCISLLPVNPDFNFQTPIFNGLLPLKIDIIITIIFWTFVINSTNFIDGYDGMFSFQIISNFAGFALIFYFLNENFHFMVSLIMVFIGAVYLPFNLFKKFKIYIGDTGSIPSGFILGWMTITLANMGYLLSAIIINSFFLFDISFTLVKRILKSKSIFTRHNDFLFKKFIIKHGAKKYFSWAILLQMTIIILSIYIVIN